MKGFGFQAAGLTPAGYGEPGAVPSPLGTSLRDELTGRPLDARKIDQRTGRYERGPDGRYVGMSSKRQMVLLAFRTTLGTAADKGMGNTIRQLDRIGDNFRGDLLARLRLALQRQIDANLLTIDDLTQFKAGPRDGLRPGQVYARLRWTDIETGQTFDEVT
jgi:hypothetical protein